MNIKKLFVVVVIQVFKWQFKIEIDHQNKVYSIEFFGENTQLTLNGLIDSSKEQEQQLAVNYLNSKLKGYKLLNSVAYENKKKSTQA